MFFKTVESCFEAPGDVCVLLDPVVLILTVVI